MSECEFEGVSCFYTGALHTLSSLGWDSPPSGALPTETAQLAGLNPR